MRTLDAKPGAMLGIPLRQDIADHTERLAPGSTLALYTDGLVERRAQGIDPGIERLATALGSFGSAELDADLEGSADRLLPPLLSDSERDDDRLPAALPPARLNRPPALLPVRSREGAGIVVLNRGTRQLSMFEADRLEPQEGMDTVTRPGSWGVGAVSPAWSACAGWSAGSPRTRPTSRW
ncbi:hypothetical protein GCM10023238_37260 [Streptomyces heliomycini]